MPISHISSPHQINTTIKMHFYDPSEDAQGFVNHMVSHFDPPFCHCEIQLPNGWACSIYMNTTIHYRQRQFRSKNYICLCIPCSQYNVDLAGTKIEDLMEQNQSFSTQALFGAYCGLDLCPTNSTFCSKLACEILQTANILPDTIEPNITSPSKLFEILQCLPGVYIQDKTTTAQAPVRSTTNPTHHQFINLSPASTHPTHNTQPEFMWENPIDWRQDGTPMVDRLLLKKTTVKLQFNFDRWEH